MERAHKYSFITFPAARFKQGEKEIKKRSFHTPEKGSLNRVGSTDNLFQNQENKKKPKEGVATAPSEDKRETTFIR